MTRIFAELKATLAQFEDRLALQTNQLGNYTLVTKKPSPMKQHKGHPMFFGSVRLGKAHASYHLMPLYMCAPLQAMISPGLKKRMQGKSCFNFKTPPGPELLAELTALTEAGLERWRKQDWT